MNEFDAHGIRFRYPESWTLSDDSGEDKVAVTVQSDGTAFWTVAVFSDGPPAEHVLESAVAAYREDYPELDIYPPETHAGPLGTVIIRELEFVCLELIAVARLEAFQTGDRTVLVLSQAADKEFESRRRVLEAMTASLEVVSEEEPIWPKDLFEE